jgi:serine/threonine-protein kinase
MKLMRDLVGDTLSERYRLVARVAGGGMGEVYRAHDLLLDRTVAVKVLQPSLAQDPDLVDRFRAEARAAARLNHPNLVGVHDWGSDDDRTYYMVMEYVSGTDLRDVLVTQGSLAPAHAVEMIASVCDALWIAHAAGLVHRDIKPENILLARDGTTKVADFGIAAVTDAERTMPGGAITGTLRYLSPEQARGEDATHLSDIWATGAVLSELLTGLPPQQGAGAELLQRRASEPPSPPSTWDPSIPADLDAVVLKACALDPADRYADASDMASDLRRVAARSVPDAPPVTELLDQVTGEIRLPELIPTSVSPHRRGGRRSKRASRGRAWIVLAAVIVLLLGGAAVARVALPRSVDVPRLVGLDKSEALERAEKIGLDALVVDRVNDMDVEKGAVVSQSPATGELEEGSTIELTLSLGPPKVKLIDLTGMQLQDAKEKLEKLELTVADIDDEFSLEKPGTVLSQSEDGRVIVGTAVSLVVSKGPRPVDVPDVTGLKEDEAVAVLKDAGFVPVPTDAYSDVVKPGKVIGTDPGAAVTIDEGSEVIVYVSIGPEFEKLKMPDVRGMSAEAAKSKLENLGLRVTVQQPEACQGGSTVVETDPTPGTTVTENDVVAIFVC